MEIPTEVIAALSSVVLTAMLGVYAKVRSNELMLNDTVATLRELEERIYNHERRISRLENGWVK